MNEEMPVADIDVITVVLNRETAEVTVDYQGMNCYEALGVLTHALRQLEEEPFQLVYEGEEDEDF